MKTTTSFRTATARAMLFFTLLIAIATLAVGPGCRKKSNPFIPPDSNAGRWTLQLHGPRIMYRDHPGGHVPNNDSISVRVYDQNGILQSGVLVHSQCDVSRDSIALLVTTRRDTAADWRGCDPHLTYWGSGGEAGNEVIRSYVMADTDTVWAAFGFKVRDPS